MATASANAPGRPFKEGNKGGPGNPHAAKVGKLRAQLYEKCITDEGVEKVWRKLEKLATQDEDAAAALGAIKEYLRWAVTKPIEPVDEDGQPDSEETTIKLIITSKDKAKAVVIPEEPSE